MFNKILIVSHFAGSPAHGMVIRNFLLAREWVRQGHSVTILASDFSHYRAVQPNHKSWKKIEYIEGVRYIWVKGLKYKASSSFGRVFSMAWFTVQCYLHSLHDSQEYDVVIASSPHPFVIYPATSIAKRHSAYLVYDIRDLWPLTPIHLGGHSPKHPFIRAMQHAEDYACRHADLIIAVQKNAEEYLQCHGLEAGRFLHVANGYSSEKSPPQPLPPDIADTLETVRSSGAFVIGYCGALGTANAMHLVVEALAACTNTRLHLAILGDGPDKAMLKASVQAHGIADRVHFFDPIARAAVNNFLEQVDAAYIGGHSSPLYKYGSSLTKLNDYFAARKPVIYGLGDPQNPISVSGAGIEYEPGSVAGLVRALDQMASLPPQQRVEMGEKGLAWLRENREMSIIAASVLTKLQQINKRISVK